MIGRTVQHEEKVMDNDSSAVPADSQSTTASSTESAQNVVALKVPTAPQPARSIPLFNREFSWLEFNQRVLSEAEDPKVPMLERLKFVSITASNLDEFIMVRVGGLRDLVAANVAERSADGLTPKQQLKGIRERVRILLERLYAAFDANAVKLAAHDIRIDDFSAFSDEEKAILRAEFERNIAPILTPLALDPGHPFPFLPNLTVTLAVQLETTRGDEHVAFVRVPPLLPRWIALEGTTRFVPLESLIAANLSSFFPGLRVRKVTPFRILRNADFSIREEEVENLLQSVEAELRRRDRKEAVTIEIAADADDSLLDVLTRNTGVLKEDVILNRGLLRLSDLMQVYLKIRKPSLMDPPFNPRIPLQLATSDDMFSIIRTSDILLHRPYDSFTAVVEFVQSASVDPDVVAIKQTLYRTDEGSPIIEALVAAAAAGKQVTAIVELQARFDEMKNIAWAKRLENAGVQVVYGLVGIKTHCKLCLVVRREGDELRRYVHLSTGNYNARTGRIYTDIDLFTCEPGFGEDATQLINLITGFSISSVQEVFENQVNDLKWKRFIVSPIDYHLWVVRQIEREIAHAAAGRPGRIVAKLNALVDPAVIDALYRASEAGVKVELIIRGICCLVPGVPGVSDNIRVISVIDRFLEHARIFAFDNGGNPEVFVSSGDWMPRNFLRRMEATFPILEPALRDRVLKEILATSLSDNVKGWRLQPDGSYKRRKAGEGKVSVRSQERFIEIARSEAVRIGSYEESLRKPASIRRKVKRHKRKDKDKK
jgi:polyphosphate kinase